MNIGQDRNVTQANMTLLLTRCLITGVPRLSNENKCERPSIAMAKMLVCYFGGGV